MNHRFHLLLVLAVACAGIAAPAHAQVETIRTPLLRQAERQQIGAQYGETTGQATAAAMQGRTAEAREMLEPVLAYCDALDHPQRRVVSVANAAEYERYVDTHGDGRPVDWIDITCASAYKTRAFVDVEDKHAQSALAFLDKTVRMAPYWALPLAERGYLLNQIGRPAEGMASYQQALELVEEFPSNANARALVLRGIGYSHIELGDLDSAERAYRTSLEAEPGNALALRELEFIRQQRSTATPAPASQSAATPQ